MRDSLEIYRKDQPIRIDIIRNLSYPPYCNEDKLSTTKPWYPILRRGRADSSIGPSPYPTAYYGFKATCNPISAEHQWDSLQYGWCGPNGRFGRYWRSNILKYAWPLGWSSLLVSTSITTIDGKPGLLPNVSAETRGRAIRSANSKLRSDSINIGQTVGEMPEALRELSKFVTGIGKTILALKKGNIPRAQYHLGTVLGKKRAVDTTKGVADAYLFYKFGVAPVLNDINNMVGEIHKAFSRPDFIKVKGTATNAVSLFGWNGWYSEGEALEVCEVGYSVRPKPHYALAFLGLTNPLATLWELVPLSFVANWFVSIGDTLNALDAGVGLEFVSGYQTTVVKGKYDVLNAESQSWDIQCKYEIDLFAMERKVLSSPGIPGLYFKTQGLGTGQLTTISALLFSAVDSGNLGFLAKAK